jgi:hypothetical protein
MLGTNEIGRYLQSEIIKRKNAFFNLRQSASFFIRLRS